ncbi:MAG: endonuclease III [Clostridiales bacterium]|nr:endonuclease III [Clostridiales bacterium]
MQKFTQKEVNEIIERLEKMHPEAHCELNFDTPFEALVAIILSAQCTDKRVNLVTQDLYKKYNTPQQFASLDIKELEELIKPCGFYKNKAKNIKECAKQIIEEFNGEVPKTMEDLTKLAGVGRKTANVMLAEIYKQDAIAVDTHVKRVSNRIGFVKSDDPYDVEMALKKIFPKDKWSRMHHLLIFLGRYTCKAIKPNCKECLLNDICKSRR